MDGLQPAESSYSQAGEDRIVYWFFQMLGGTENLRYADLGAAFPAGHNNTYLFYTLGGEGVLVEADPSYLPLYSEVRPRDCAKQIAIVPKRLRDSGFITFYLMHSPGWNTISASHVKVAVQLDKGPVLRHVTVPCLTINELLEECFPDGRLDILSIDLEGIDTEILAELDLGRFRPKVIIVEHPNDSAFKGLADEALAAAGYERFAWTFVNHIFVDSACLRAIRV
jgi:hypothetical protein